MKHNEPGDGKPRAWDSAVLSLADADWAWWPFLRMRPRKSEVFSGRRVFEIAAIVLVIGFPIVVLYRVATGRTVEPDAGALVGVLIFAFAAGASAVVAGCWNRRVGFSGSIEEEST